MKNIVCYLQVFLMNVDNFSLQSKPFLCLTPLRCSQHRSCLTIILETTTERTCLRQNSSAPRRWEHVRSKRVWTCSYKVTIATKGPTGFFYTVFHKRNQLVLSLQLWRLSSVSTTEDWALLVRRTFTFLSSYKVTNRSEIPHRELFASCITSYFPLGVLPSPFYWNELFYDCCCTNFTFFPFLRFPRATLWTIWLSPITSCTLPRKSRIIVWASFVNFRVKNPEPD